MHQVIFVCTGNVCRSPMAEGILKQRWSGLDRSDLIVSSMGIHGLDHQPATEFARQVCADHGIDISNHVSRQLGFDELKRSDFIFALETVHKNFINLYVPQLVDRLFLLGSWPDNDSPKCNIRDPMGGSIKDYRNAYDTIAFHIDRILPYLQEIFG